MICFCDKEVYSICEQELNRSEIFSFFLKKQNMNSVLAIYSSDEKYIGMVTYNTLLYAKDKTLVEVMQDKVYVSDDMFDKAEKIFRKHNQLDLLPVFNNEDELVSFCFKSAEGPEYNFLVNSLKQIERKNNGVFFNKIYPNVKVVYIYGLNEWAYKIYKILIMNNFPVAVKGNKWTEIFGISESEDIYPDFQRCNIIAEYIMEENNWDIIKNYYYENNFGILRKLSNISHIYEEVKWKKHFEEIGVKYLLCSNMFREEYSNYTPNELFRISNNLFIDKIEQSKNNKEIQNQFKYVSNMEYSEFSRKKNEYIKMNKIKLSFNNTIINCDVYGNGKNTIYLIAPPCISQNIMNLKNNSFQEYLIKMINKQFNESYKLISISVHDVDFGLFNNVMSNLRVTPKDVIITINRHFNKIFDIDEFVNYIDYDLRNIIYNRDLDKEYFYDEPMHLNWRGNEILANDLYNKFIKAHLEKVKDVKVEYNDLLGNIEKQELDRYLDSIKKYKQDEKNNGAIVMNCNPFTNGHLYLIEQALKKVDYLYIFVVEEDKSFFKFNERFELVKKGVEHLKNVSVIPSGKYILSYTTLPSYFEKETNQNVVIDASNDINIFSKYIAPHMNIKVSLVGEEPLDNITKQYNEEMRKTLKANGIDFIEIPRLQYDNKVISASYVRKLIKEHNFDEIKNMVPESTYKFLCEKYL